MARMDIAGAMANAKTMLSQLTAWQDICHVQTPTEAAERIYQGGTEDDGSETVAPCIILRVDPLNTDWMPSTSHGRLTIEVRTEIPIPAEQCETYQTQYVYAWQQVSAMLAGINGSVNDGGQLMLQSLNMPLEPGPIDPDENHGRVEWLWIMAVVLEFI